MKPLAFFDTEFYDDGKDVHLISLGVVTDNVEYYVETPKAKELAYADPWLRDNVYPHLDGIYVRDEQQIGADLITLFSGHKFWGWYVTWDWYLVCRLYGLMLNNPLGHRASDIAQEADRLRYRFKSRTKVHKAIECARWTKQAHDELVAYEKESH